MHLYALTLFLLCARNNCVVLLTVFSIYFNCTGKKYNLQIQLQNYKSKSWHTSVKFTKILKHQWYWFNTPTPVIDSQSKVWFERPPFSQLNWKFWLVLHPSQTCLLLLEARGSTPVGWKVPIKRQLALFLRWHLCLFCTCTFGEKEM